MKITDIIRGVLDLADMAVANTENKPDVTVSIDAPVAPEVEDEQQSADLVDVLKHLAGINDCEEQLPEYANEPNEVVAPTRAAYPGGDDMHARKDPSDIRSDSVSMYPNYQAKV